MKTLYLGYCVFWEDVLKVLLPAGGLREWGKMLFIEPTRLVPDPEMDPRTTAKKECLRLSHELEGLKCVTGELSKSAFHIDPYAHVGLDIRAHKLDRVVDIMGNIIDELIVLHNSGLDGLLDAEREGSLNYQIFRF